MTAPRPGGRDVVAIVLATGASAALVALTIAAIVNAFENKSGLSENATQILSTAFGSMFGTLGAYLGFKSGEQRRSSVAVELEPRITDAQSQTDDTSSRDTSPSS